MPDEPPRNPLVTSERIRAYLPLDLVTPPRGHTAVPASTTYTSDELLRVWAGELTADRDAPASPVPPTPAGDASPRRAAHPLGPVARPLIAVALVVLAGLGVFLGAGDLVTGSLADNVRRVPGVFGGLDETTRPVSNASTTFLLVGTDPQSGPAQPAGTPQADVLMIARLDLERSTASITSVPHDLAVDIPGVGRGKIGAAYDLGGPTLLVRTVEQLTGLRVDHFAVVDFGGFRSMVDAVGGIDVAAPAGRPGVDHLDGRGALAYMRGALGGPGRAEREQDVLRALVEQVAARGTLAGPAATLELLDAASRSVSVDDTLSNGGLRALAADLNGIRPTGVTFLRAPVGPPVVPGERSEVHLDPARAAELWEALRTDRAADYASVHAAETGAPR